MTGLVVVTLALLGAVPSGSGGSATLAELMRQRGFPVAAAQLHGELGCASSTTHGGRVSIATLAALALELGDVAWIPSVLSRCYSHGFAYLGREHLDRVNFLVGVHTLVSGHPGEATNFFDAVTPSSRTEDFAALAGLAASLRGKTRTSSAGPMPAPTAERLELDGPYAALTRLLAELERERAARSSVREAELGAELDEALARAEPVIRALATRRAQAVAAEHESGRFVLGAVRLRRVPAPEKIVVPPRIRPKPRPAWVGAEPSIFRDSAAGMLYGRGRATGIRNEDLAISVASSRAAGEFCRAKAMAEGQSPTSYACGTYGPYEIVDQWREPETGAVFALARMSLALLHAPACADVPEASGAWLLGDQPPPPVAR